MERGAVVKYQHVNVEAGERPKGNGARPEPEPVRSESLDQTEFFCQMLRELTGTLERVVGDDLAEGYISVVGAALGQWINAQFQDEINASPNKLQSVANVLIELKQRINGGFYIKSIDAEKIVLGNTSCPFGPAAVGRPSLCAVTTQVFGTVVSTNLDYACVRVEEAIARGDRECLVTVHLTPPEDNLSAQGVEFFKDPGPIDI